MTCSTVQYHQNHTIYHYISSTLYTNKSFPSLHLPNLIPHHLIRPPTIPISHLPRPLHPSNRQAVLERLALLRLRPVRQRERERQVLRQQTQLGEGSRLVPCYVLVVEPVASDVDDGREGDFELAVSRGKAGEAVSTSADCPLVTSVQCRGLRGQRGGLTASPPSCHA